MKSIVKNLLLLSAFVFVSGGHAASNEEFYDDMNRMCAETNTKSSAVFITSCYQYIRGFLQGAVVTDTAIMDQVSGGNLESEFAKRAYRTRVGIERNTIPATFYAGFCLPEDRVTHDVVLALLTDVQQRFSQVADAIPTNPLSEHLYGLLRQRYPCEFEVE